MTMRRMLLGVMAGTMCSVAMAKPPGGPLSEGREVDPVVRDFQLNASPVIPESESPARATDKPGDLFSGSLFAALSDVILNGMTIPLGTVSPVESR